MLKACEFSKHIVTAVFSLSLFYIYFMCAHVFILFVKCATTISNVAKIVILQMKWTQLG